MIIEVVLFLLCLTFRSVDLCEQCSDLALFMIFQMLIIIVFMIFILFKNLLSLEVITSGREIKSRENVDMLFIFAIGSFSVFKFCIKGNGAEINIV